MDDKKIPLKLYFKNTICIDEPDIKPCIISAGHLLFWCLNVFPTFMGTVSFLSFEHNLLKLPVLLLLQPLEINATYMCSICNYNTQQVNMYAHMMPTLMEVR